MAKKKSKDNISIKKILIHLAVMAITAVLLVFLTMAYLNIYTRHGQSVDVPHIEGLQLGEANTILRAKGLKMHVLDSVYVRNAVPGAIMDQKPRPNNNVKIGRTIYVTVFASNPRQVAIPNVINVSSRQVLATLSSMGFNQITIREVPSVHAGEVLGVEYRGRALEVGETVPYGSPLRLIVGAGAQVLEEHNVRIPVGVDAPPPPPAQGGIDHTFR